MGYTHYWYTNLNGIPQKNWSAICEDVKKLLASLPARSTSAGAYHSNDPLELAFESDSDKPPKIGRSLIRFNGKDGGKDLGHETFYFERHAKQEDYREGNPELFAFCKTARKPYDLVVCGVLIVIGKHAGEYVRIDSDGGKDDWKPALEWVWAVLGDEYGLPPALWPLPQTATV
jgi:hypothetical protein